MPILTDAWARNYVASPMMCLTLRRSVLRSRKGGWLRPALRSSRTVCCRVGAWAGSGGPSAGAPSRVASGIRCKSAGAVPAS
jgi:hypothetical protein